jgi:outer membrane protein assembly factor BamB
VFAFYPEVGLLAYSLEGEERWRVPLGPFGAVQGLASSPVLAEGRVVLLIDTPEQAYLVAYDAKTGKQAWKADRPIGFLGSYATPSVYEPKSGGAQIVVAGAVELTGYDAKTGARVWWVTGVTNAPAVLPLVDGDAVFTTEPLAEGPSAFQQWLGQFDKNKNGAIEIAEAEGESVNAKIMTRIFRSLDQNGGNKDGAVTEDEYRQAFHPGEPAGGLVRTKLGGQGDVTKTHVGWRHKKGLPYVTAPVLYDGLLYVVRNGGILTVFRPETGEVVREERLKDAGGEYYAQPVAGDGKVYFANKDGKVTVIRAGEKWELLSSGDLTEQVIATPALADGRIYVRTAGTLYCFGKSGS